MGTTAIRTRSRSNTNASLGPGPITLASPPSVGTPPPPPPPPPPPLESESKSSGHGKTDSESDASVYTQPSPLVDGSFAGTAAPAPPRTSSLGPNGSIHRPAPLKLGAGAGASHAGMQGPPPRSPLLHTTWGSPLSSPALQKPNGGFAVLGASDHKDKAGDGDSPPGSAASNTGYTGTGEGFRVGGGGVASASAGAGGAYFPAGELGMGGMASAMRQRLEVERKPSVEVERGVEERARRIVVEEEEGEDEEEEDEVVIGDVSFGSSVATERGEERERERDASVGAVMHESPSLSSSPELLVQGRLAPLGVANKRSPSVSSGEEGRQGVPVVSNPPPSQAHLGTPPLSTLRPPSSTTSSPSPSHLRPTLSEIRPDGQRRSLFLPHPNAPKAPAAHSPGPMYMVQQQPPPHPPQHHQIRGGVMQTIRMALAGQGPQQGPRGRGPTIYGVTMEDLGAAMGPVLMQFSLNPAPATAPPGGVAVMAPAVKVSGPAGGGVQVQIVAPTPIRRVGSMASLDMAAGREQVEVGASGLIPRANFFPKAGGVRPRSRSFSGFQSTTAEIPLPIQRRYVCLLVKSGVGCSCVVAM
ncbi:hypothetical protein FPV67DRAFT_814386 [Lyophyllum atratum]|nr:hypothetical protein FPV67DRAFT_814386 [Lyophyllum atratum]